ncbi:fimbria/pilus periplasmic chaperone [Pseudomonas sp. SWRI79]|uniref:Fimbria/pilus periplasmic chaperone n=1 Tax=Pseudomonas farris TaxID=2841207 RepID=A0ABS6PZF2_9PSED|nr:fimbria/pilus periplasmic chaperone [Pseudomonas farris]MBV4465852.1 fimbria/pilus periplasmic chaperone [Pseudomonas farris]
MKHSLMRCLALGVLVSGFASVSPAHASIVLNNTRVVYEAQDRETSVKLTNAGKKPLVVQSWIDDGDVKKDPSLMKLPFILMPPITRVDPGKGQTLRLMYTGEALPQDRESVFYLNLLEIPPKAATSADQNIMQIALRTRVKVFFRPANLKGNSSEAPKKLLWTLLKKESGWSLECTNPSSYYVSMTEIALSTGKTSLPVSDGMVAPGGTLKVPVSSVPAGTTGVKYQAIDDYGAAREHTVLLSK